MAGFTNRKTTNDSFKRGDSYYKYIIRAHEADNTADTYFRTPPYYARFIKGYKNPYKKKGEKHEENDI